MALGFVALVRDTPGADAFGSLRRGSAAFGKWM